MPQAINAEHIPYLSYNHPLKARCSRFLSRHQPLSTAQWLQRMQTSKYSQFSMDCFGSGYLVNELERRVADLLGKPKALFFHKGMIGQLSALQVWARDKNNSHVAFQTASHIHFDEGMAFEQVFHFNHHLIGQARNVFTANDLSDLPEVSVLSLELPHRRNGFLLPEWNELLNTREYCNRTSSAFHIDGARLFEAAPYWQKSPAQVADLADSVYVSLYKTLGALAGGVVAGDEDLIKALKPWKSRLGGDLHTVFPYVITALEGIDRYLPKIPEFIEHSQRLAELVKQVLGAEALPYTIQSNCFVVDLPVSPRTAIEIALNIAAEDKVWLFDGVSDAPGNKCRVEVQIGDAIEKLNVEELKSYFSKFSS